MRLKPPPPTPAEEICSCAGEPPLILRSAFSSNPVSCADCNLEVPPERLGFSATMADDLAGWCAFYQCFYSLWLDSGEFEDWAKTLLSDPASAPNARGLALRARLDGLRRCYFWWFQDPGHEDFEPLADCPACGAPLTPRAWGLVCEACSILVAN